MLDTQVRLLTTWWAAGETISGRLDAARHDERGEITAMTAAIVILVVAAIAAATVIATKINNNANAIPEP